MGNSIKKEYAKLSITKDIVERQNIIRQFRITGFLDRNDAIKKIESIQGTDAELALATIENFLTAKLAKLELEEKGNG